jgi:hypothetical protein
VRILTFPVSAVAVTLPLVLASRARTAAQDNAQTTSLEQSPSPQQEAEAPTPPRSNEYSHGGKL